MLRQRDIWFCCCQHDALKAISSCFGILSRNTISVSHCSTHWWPRRPRSLLAWPSPLTCAPGTSFPWPALAQALHPGLKLLAARQLPLQAQLLRRISPLGARLHLPLELLLLPLLSPPSASLCTVATLAHTLAALRMSRPAC
jgi:hypothetical protein